MFTEWLLRQQDRKDNVGKAARLAWSEINNGHALMRDHGIFYWRDHLVRRAGVAKGMGLYADFVAAYYAYKDALNVDE